jgi:uncharacterized lipoprotein
MRILALSLTVLLLGACSGEKTLQCGRESSYREATGADVLSVPDDLSVPDESESLRIPDATPAAAQSEQEASRCLEESPAFSLPARP